MGIIVSAVVDFFKRVASAGGDLSAEEIRLGFIRIGNTFKALAWFLNRLFNNELKAWQESYPDITAAANGLGEVGYAQWQAWDRLLTVIMPHSQTWMDNRRNRVWAKWLRNTYRPFVREMDREWAWQHGWDGHTQRWRDGYVDPTLKKWLQFHHWFDTWPHRDLSTLQGWLTERGRFAWFATPLLARPLVDYYGQPQHKRLAEHLTQIVVDRSPGIPVHVERAAAAVLQSKGW
jgi:hypothetical protein